MTIENILRSVLMIDFYNHF